MGKRGHTYAYRTTNRIVTDVPIYFDHCGTCIPIFIRTHPSYPNITDNISCYL